MSEILPVMGPAVAITDAGKIMQLVWAYGDAMYQHGRGRNDNDECPHYSEAQDVLAMFEPLLTNPTSITAAELEALHARIRELEEAGLALYTSGLWSCDELTKEEQGNAWLAFRNVFHIKEGTETHRAKENGK